MRKNEEKNQQKQWAPPNEEKTACNIKAKSKQDYKSCYEHEDIAAILQKQDRENAKSREHKYTNKERNREQKYAKERESLQSLLSI